MFNNKPIYENDKYICYTTCYGEFGGLVFFYNKINHRITLASATCTVSLIEHDDGFLVISGLAHMGGFSDVIYVENPDLLFELPDSLNNNKKWGRIYNYYPLHDKIDSFNNHIIQVYKGMDESMTSGFRIKGENYFLTDMVYKDNWDTYLTKLKNDSLVVIETPDTVFSNLPVSRGEITRKINNQTIIDYTLFTDNFEEQEEDEYTDLLVVSFIVNDTSLIRINWENKRLINYLIRGY